MIWLLASGNPVDHIIDHKITVDWAISNVTIMLILTTLITAAIVIPAARRIATGTGRSADDFRTQGTMANLVEVICLYLRDEVFKGILKDDTDRFMPILWTFFWFILVANILGLVPLVDLTSLIGRLTIKDYQGHGFGGTATQSIWVTASLALIAFLLINIVGFIRNPIGYFTHLTGGAPWFMWPIIIPVEFAGIFIKPTALAIRLFANMTGGHMMLAVLFSFVPSLIKALGVVGFGVALIPLAGATAIYMLEVLVAVLQAFIFTFLTGMFLAQLIVHEHDEEHGHEAAH
jgi:F-type H+-transporting ATPase subunit a